MIPIGCYWTGEQIVISTAPSAPKVAALSARPDVAVSIDYGDRPDGTHRDHAALGAVLRLRRRPARFLQELAARDHLTREAARLHETLGQ